MYAVAYSIDFDNINIIMCKNDDELIEAIYDLIQDEDYEFDDIDGAFDALKELIDSSENLAVTVANSSGDILFQM